MSHVGVPRAVAALAALAALTSLVSCSDVVEMVAPDVDKVHIDFTCGNVDKIGLSDGNGKSAWAVQRHQHDTIEWIVTHTVTINSIKGKTAALPIDADSSNLGGTPGKSYKATVQSLPGLPFTKKTFAYVIDVTCVDNGVTRNLVIDPELILRKP
jgi:hypothetical protein